MADIVLVDLVAQRDSVRLVVADMNQGEVEEWLAARGALTKREVENRTLYEFQSSVGHRALFFFDGGEMVFVGDHYTFT